MHRTKCRATAVKQNTGLTLKKIMNCQIFDFNDSAVQDIYNECNIQDMIYLMIILCHQNEARSSQKSNLFHTDSTCFATGTWVYILLSNLLLGQHKICLFLVKILVLEKFDLRE